jgi:hypothetical protein
VGNSTFPEDPHNLPELRGPINDLALLRDALTNLTTGLFEPQHVRLLPERTKAQILSAMERFFRSAGRQDTLLLYYSGHGQQDTIGNLFLCARDSRTDFLVSTAISDSEINGIMRESSAQTFIVILDCCHSGSFKGTGAPAGLQGTGRFVLSSSRRRELSADSAEETGTSAFTSYLVEALRLGTLDHNGDGYVSLNDVYDHILTGLRETTGQIPQRHIDNAVGDVILARAMEGPTGEAWKAASQPRERPVLDLSETDIDLPDVRPGEDVPPRAVEVLNRGGGRLHWAAETDDAWITITRERDRFWLHFAPQVGVNRGSVQVRDRGSGGGATVRVRLRVIESRPETTLYASEARRSWPATAHPEAADHPSAAPRSRAPAEPSHYPVRRARPAGVRRPYFAIAIAVVAVVLAAGVLAWSWLSDLSNAVGAHEFVAQTVVRVHSDPVRSEYVCSTRVDSGVVVEVILDYQSQEIPIVTWNGVTDKGKTIYPGTPLLLKVSNGQACS